MRSASKRLKYSIVAIALLIPFTAIVYFYPVMAPVHQGDAAELLAMEAGIDSEGTVGALGNSIELVREKEFVYSIGGFDSISIYHVSRDEVASAFPDFLVKLKKLSDKKPSPYVQLSITTAQISSDPGEFISRLHRAHDDFFKARQPKFRDDRAAYDKLISDWWKRSRRYWLNAVFETFLFSCLILFVFWPWLRNQGFWAWTFRFALLPAFLVLPYYFGYACRAFSTMGGIGEILYPQTIEWWKDGMSSIHEFFYYRLPELVPLSEPPLEIWFQILTPDFSKANRFLYSHCPKILSFLHQGPELWFQSFAPDEGPDGLGLIEALILGFAAASVFLGARYVSLKIIRRIRTRKILATI